MQPDNSSAATSFAPAVPGAAGAPFEAAAPSTELQDACKATLRMLQRLIACKGSLIASVHLRVPASLKTGALQLQRIAQLTGRSSSGAGGRSHDSTIDDTLPGLRNESKDAIMIGGPGSSLTEEHIAAQATLSLPSLGHLVVPLSHSSFLVRC